MLETERRSFLAGTAAVLLAGCTGSGGSDDSDSNQGGGGGGSTPTPRPDSDSDGVPDREDDFPNDSSFSVLVDEVSDTRQIPEDELYQWHYSLTEQSTISYDFVVREGPAIDAILTTEDEYNELIEGNRARYISEGSDLDSTGGGATATVSPGTYYIVFDNTNYGEAKPPTNFDDDLAEVEVDIQVRR